MCSMTKLLLFWLHLSFSSAGIGNSPSWVGSRDGSSRGKFVLVWGNNQIGLRCKYYLNCKMMSMTHESRLLQWMSWRRRGRNWSGKTNSQKRRNMNISKKYHLFNHHIYDIYDISYISHHHIYISSTTRRRAASSRDGQGARYSSSGIIWAQKNIKASKNIIKRI